MTTKLHSRLNNQSSQHVNTIKSKSLGKDTFSTADASLRPGIALRLDQVLGTKGSGENTLHEIQAIIISQEIKDSNNKIMNAFTDKLSMQIAHHDGTKQLKIIPEKFKRKEFHSQAHEN